VTLPPQAPTTGRRDDHRSGSPRAAVDHGTGTDTVPDMHAALHAMGGGTRSTGTGVPPTQPSQPLRAVTANGHAWPAGHEPVATGQVATGQAATGQAATGQAATGQAATGQAATDTRSVATAATAATGQAGSMTGDRTATRPRPVAAGHPGVSDAATATTLRGHARGHPGRQGAAHVTARKRAAPSPETPADQARGQTPAEPSPVPQWTGKKRSRTIYLPEDLLDRLRAAVAWASYEGPEDEPQGVTEFVERAVGVEVLRMEREYNDGKPFRKARRLRPGRRAERTDEQPD